MEKFDIHEIESKLTNDLEHGAISGRNLLDRLRVIDEDSRKTAPYLDHKYAPFYYHLGKYIKPKSVVEIGFDLGLLSCSFFTSCKTVVDFFGYREISPTYASIRLGRSNISLRFKGHADYYVGKMLDEEFARLFSSRKWDLIIVNDEKHYDKHLEYLEIVWSNLSEHGLVVCEYIKRHNPAKDAFFAFAESRNRQPVTFSTRYGTGIIQK